MLRLLIVALIAAALFACDSGGDNASPEGGLPRAQLTFVTAGGQRHNLSTELTCTAADREMGLMFRKDLPENSGMLFLFAGGSGGFWMKNTLIPLTVAFIDSGGAIVHLEDMEPQTLVVHNSPRPFYYGLEANQGWFQRKGIAVGDRVTFPWPLDPPPVTPPACN